LAQAAETLQELGVPAVEARGGNLLETPEFTDAYMALRFLAHPGDEEALLRLLHSPFFAVSQREVLELVSRSGEGVQSGKEVDLWGALGKLSRPSPGLGRAREVLEELLRRRALEAPSRLLQRLDERTGYTGVVARLPRGRRRVRDWEGTLELVRRLEVGAEDPFLVARKLRLLLRGEVQVERPPLEAGNALALLTVHAAKGLEWPVVFILHVGGWKGNGGLRKDKPLFRPGLALVPPLLDDEGEPSSLFLLAKAALEEEERAEEERLLYVAATRAGERLYLLLSSKEGKQDSLRKELEEAGAAHVGLEEKPLGPGEAAQGEGP
ncbi:MAG: DNA helicase UvrD, partial [Thermus sp.]|uniref:3'-5' exonuclease n=1 Tax=Thermus sp. TaxID=275 RepID=UPI0025D1411E